MNPIIEPCFSPFHILFLIFLLHSEANNTQYIFFMVFLRPHLMRNKIFLNFNGLTLQFTTSAAVASLWLIINPLVFGSNHTGTTAVHFSVWVYIGHSLETAAAAFVHVSIFPWLAWLEISGIRCTVLIDVFLSFYLDNRQFRYGASTEWTNGWGWLRSRCVRPVVTTEC